MSIKDECLAVMEELVHKADLHKGDILVVGCSTSEVVGSKIGTNSDPDTAAEIYEGISTVLNKYGIYMAVQCCEHLNRAIVVEREAVPFAEAVNVIPQKKAGGSLATVAYSKFTNPVVIEEIKANAGIDIGLTLIGMHLKKVAVPLRLSTNKIGNALFTCARTRPKFIGGERAVYDRDKM